MRLWKRQVLLKHDSTRISLRGFSVGDGSKRPLASSQKDSTSDNVNDCSSTHCTKLHHYPFVVSLAPAAACSSVSFLRASL